MRHVVVCSAAYFEARPLLDKLRSLSVRHTYLEMGVGPIMAAATAAKFQRIAALRHVIYVGTAGWGGSFSAPSLVVARNVTWRPIDVRRKMSYVVGEDQVPIELNPLPIFAGTLSVTVSCAGSISVLEDHDESLYENLELFSIAKLWSGHASSFTAILGITNKIGVNAHAEWKKNFPEAARLASQQIIDSAALNYLG